MKESWKLKCHIICRNSCAGLGKTCFGLPWKDIMSVCFYFNTSRGSFCIYAEKFHISRLCLFLWTLQLKFNSHLLSYKLTLLTYVDLAIPRDQRDAICKIYLQALLILAVICEYLQMESIGSRLFVYLWDNTAIIDISNVLSLKPL